MRYSALLIALPLAVSCPVKERAVVSGVLKDTYPIITFGQSRQNINSYTEESIQSLLGSVNPKNGQFLGGSPDSLGQFFFWQSNNAWTSIAQYDLQQGSKTFYEEYSKAQDALAKNPGHGFETYGVGLCNDFNDDCGWAALNSLTAFEAYGDAIFLQRAVNVWNFITAHGFVDQAAIDAKYLKGTKNPEVTLQSQCNGKSMLGGVYWKNGPVDPDVNAISTGNYGLLSVELCRLTGDMKYCDRAYETARWLDDHMVKPDGLLMDHYNAADCGLKDWTFTYNAGLYIAIYAELGHLTQNSSATGLAERTAKATMTTGQWNTDNGVIKEGEGDAAVSDDGIGFKSIMIRYLAKVHPWLADEGVKAAIVQYINIQYWALTTLASNSATHPVQYGRNWNGPAYTVSTAHAQLAALDVLNGIQLNPDSAFPSSNDLSKPVASSSK